ncbi:MAG TPA: tetratricopeptide repeat protein [Verrucomicrobiales bacterium]|nr:tetratricopeptide repeat protein [Verrucomicrobiales bacterium]
MRTFPGFLRRLLTFLLFVALFAGCSSKAKKGRHEESAKKYFDAGEYEKAKLEYINVLKLEPGNPAALGRMGLIWSLQGAPLRAIPYLQEYCRLSPGDISLRGHLLASWMAISNLKEAREEAMATLKLNPDNADALTTLAEIARSPEEIAGAREQIAKFPDQRSAAVHLASAFLSLWAKDRAGADIALTRSLAADPGSPKALLLSATLLLKDNDISGAEAKFKTAALAAPVRSFQRIRYAEYKSQQKTPEAQKEAVAFISKMLEEAPDYLPALTLSAQLALTEKRTEEGMAALEKVFAMDRENLPARLLQARGWLARGQTQKAAEELERMLSVYPGHLMVKFQLAQAYVQGGAPAKAGPHLKEIVKNSPGFVDAVLLLAELNLRSGEPEAAVTPVTQMLKQYPAHPLASYLLVEIYEALRRPEDALTVLADLIKASPKDPRPRFREAEVLRTAGRINDSRTVFEALLKMSPDSFAITVQLVELDMLEKKSESALKRIDEFIGRKPEVGGAYFVKGKVHASLKAWNEAERALLKSIELDEKNADAYRLLASVYAESGRLPEAVTRLETLLAKDPRDIRGLKQAAVIYEKQGQYEKAAASNDQLLAILPEPEPMILNNQAYLLIEHLGQPDKALELARRARALRPGTQVEAGAATKNEAAAIADTLGWILFRRREYKDALALIRETANVLKDNPEVQFHLGMTSYMMGDLVQARAAFKKVKDADFPGKEEALAKLALIGESDVAVSALPAAELEALLKKNPGDVFVQARLGEALEKEKNHAAAADAYEKALALNPNLIPVALRLARLYAGPLEKLDKALEVAKKARLLAPAHDPAVAGVLGEIEYKSGNFAAAYELLKESSRESKADAEILKSLGWAAYNTGNVAEARDAMEELLKLTAGTPEEQGIKSFLALTAADAGKGAPSLVTAADELLKKDPGNVPALMVKAAAEPRPEAAARYEDILKRLPDFAPAKKRLAALYIEDPAQWAKGYKLASSARETLPGDHVLIQTQAILSYHLKDYSNAIQLLQESGRTRPLDAKGLFYIGMARFELGDKAGSTEALTSALAAGLPEAMDTEARRVLAKAQGK